MKYANSEYEIAGPRGYFLRIRFLTRRKNRILNLGNTEVSADSDQNNERKNRFAIDTQYE